MWNCLNCILLNKQTNMCNHFKMMMDKEMFVENCPYYSKEIIICPSCGTQFISDLALVYDLNTNAWKGIQCRTMKGEGNENIHTE